MNSISLDGEWQLSYFPEEQFTLNHPAELNRPGVSTVPARVPGNVELDLQRAGILPEPFYADNIFKLRPYEFYQWWYTREFDVPAEAYGHAWDLLLAGADTIATVWINGIEVGSSANMLIEHRFDVSNALRFGQKNTIAVRLRSPLNYARQFRYDASVIGPEGRFEALWLRKAAHMYGWDIMPRAVTAGLWRSVSLEEHKPNAIEQIYYWTAGIAHEGASLGVRFQFRTDSPTTDGFTMRFHGACGDHTFDFDWPCEFIADGCHIFIPGARLWWPKGYGEPNLYTVTAQLVRDGQVLDERTERVGLRKLVVDRTEKAGQATAAGAAHEGVRRTDKEPDPNSHFVFYVNDTPIMIKGSNWVPLDAFHSRDAARYEKAVALFDDLGCNMIRCWGGNVYEDHPFFDLCDEKGILVWQDCAFACAFYPQTEDFLAQVRAEIQAVAEKLRNHPSLALWCGDNENDAFYVGTGLEPSHNRLTREVIPQVLHRCDPYRHYVPSSPYVPPSLEHDPQVWVRTPEQHLWGPRGYFKGAFYMQHSAHFIGEMGYHGCNNVSSIKQFISPERLWPWQDNPEWRVHDVSHWQHRKNNRDRIRLMANQVQELFGAVPETLEDFALASQITQAEAKKFFVESSRMRKWITSGVLWWNVIDGWPQFSDAIVDYYFGRKLAYDYIRRVQRPVCVMIGEQGPDKYLPVIIANDTRQDAAVTYRVWDADSNKTLAEGAFTVPANQNWQVARIRTYVSDHKLYLITWQVNGETFGNHYLSAQPPVSLQQYKQWLRQIAALPRPFDPDQVAR